MTVLGMHAFGTASRAAVTFLLAAGPDAVKGARKGWDAVKKSW
jgi:hypothetical protein